MMNQTLAQPPLRSGAFNRATGTSFVNRHEKSSAKGAVSAVKIVDPDQNPAATKVVSDPWEQQPKRNFAPVIIVALLHVLVFWVIQSGAVRHFIPRAEPKEIYLTTILPKTQPAPAEQAKKPAKTVAVAQPTPQPQVQRHESPIEPVLPVTATAPVQAASAPPAAAPVVAVPATAPPVAAPAASPAAIKVITSGVEYLQPPRPVYPAMSKRLKEEGKVTLRILVNEKGLPESVEVQKSSGFSRLDEAARQAVLAARFKPYMEDGKAAAVYVVAPISWDLGA